MSSMFKTAGILPAN